MSLAQPVDRNDDPRQWTAHKFLVCTDCPQTRIYVKIKFGELFNHLVMVKRVKKVNMEYFKIQNSELNI